MQGKKFMKWVGIILLPIVAVAGAACAYSVGMVYSERQCTNPTLAAETRVSGCQMALRLSMHQPPQLAEIWNELGYIYQEMGQDENSKNAYATAARLYPPAWHIHLAQAESYDQRAEHGKAIVAYTRAILPNSILLANMYSERANAYDLSGDLPKALDDYNMALTLVPSKGLHAKYQIDRGILYARNPATWDLALADFNGAIESNHSVGNAEYLEYAYMERGRIEYLRKDYDAAILDFMHVAEMDKPAKKGYGLIWLFLAETGAGKDATANLKSRLSNIGSTEWPIPMAQLLAGDVKVEDIQAPTIPPAWARDRQEAAAHCEIAYYLGEQALLKNDTTEATKQFQTVIDTGVKEYTEYWLATYQLSKLQITATTPALAPIAAPTAAPVAVPAPTPVLAPAVAPQPQTTK